jgi:hypothetical protein
VVADAIAVAVAVQVTDAIAVVNALVADVNVVAKLHLRHK